MPRVVKTINEAGVSKSVEPGELEEHRRCVLRVEPGRGQGAIEDDDTTGWETAQRFIGLWKDAPADDLAENHDAYLYDRRD